ncbi:MAG: TM2 domain-containing protein [Cyanobacteria bacterium QS_8_64_29]|nr:MAG: TM2 domain-containing protein [Cyanobacteria bacterium QS_8_64_29]
MKNREVAYVLWLLCLTSLCGLHRIYLGRYASGIVYLLTLGLFGIGQLIDLVLIPGMVREENLKQKALRQEAAQAGILEGTASEERLEVRILRVCRDRDGATVSDCAIETAASPARVKEVLAQLMREEAVTVDNRASDGAVVYRAI